MIRRASKLKSIDESRIQQTYKPYEIELANKLYDQDFQTFNYQKEKSRSEIRNEPRCSDELTILEQASAVQWHWGPTAQKQTQKMRATKKQ